MDLLKKVLLIIFNGKRLFIAVIFSVLFCNFSFLFSQEKTFNSSGAPLDDEKDCLSCDVLSNGSKNICFDFSDCDIRDIIYAVSIDSGISIIADDTVKGTGNFKFSGGNLESAFDAFLLGNRLYVSKSENVWTVSKFRFSSTNDKYFVDAYDLYPFEIVEKISEHVDWALTFDSLPNMKMSIHFKDMDKKSLVSGLCKLFGNYEAVENSSGIHIKKKNDGNNYFTNSSSSFSNFGNSLIIEKNDDNTFSVDINEASFFSSIELLFSENKISDFCILSNSDSTIKRACFSGYDFQDTLEKLCCQNGYSYIKDENIFYITVDIDAKSKLLIGERNWNSFSLSYTSTDEFLPVLFKKFGNLETIPLFDKYSFLCNCSESEKKLIEDFINEADVKRSVFLVSLKYLKPAEFLQHLPPSIDKNCLFSADDNSCLYFRGTEDAYNNLCEQIEVCDKPVTRLSYDLLILQYDETKQDSWASNFGARKLRLGDRPNISATLGSVMGFNLNVISAFGVAFAADLQASIEENSTDVYADTTLHGVVGKKISFQNTNTYRYRDNNVDPENGKPVYSGVTKEIITGIKIDILGWVSGDGVITSSVTASISRQGIDSSSSTGNPPPTSEKLVTTEVSGKSGEPIVLSGLLLSAENKSEKRAPFISKIPIIGKLFKNKIENKEKSQMIIYLVPHIENDNQFSEKKNSEYGEEWFTEQIDFLIGNTY